MKKNISKNISFSLLHQIVLIFCEFLISRLIIKTFGSNINGLIVSITQFLGYITLLEAGIGPVIKYNLFDKINSKNKKTINEILKASEKIFKNIAKLYLVYILVLIIIYPLIVNNVFDNVFTMLLLVIISISTFFEYYFGITYRFFLQADKKSYVISIIHIITNLINVLIIIILIHFKINILIIKLVSSLAFVLRPILQNMYVKREYNINLKNVRDTYKIKNKWDGFAGHIAFVIHKNIDVVLITIFASLLEVSVYSIYNLVLLGIKKITLSLTSGIDANFGELIVKKDYGTLKKEFSKFEKFYLSSITIIYSCTLVLIIPFVSLYTRGIDDINYIRPLFAIIFVISEYIYALRLPYNYLIKAGGYFKETKIWGWIEALINLTLSIILIFKYGIVGVVIGTLIAMLIRTIECIYFSSKCILKRNLNIPIKRVLISIIEMIIIYILLFNISNLILVNFGEWILYGFIVFVLSILLVLSINFILYRKGEQ